MTRRLRLLAIALVGAAAVLALALFGFSSSGTVTGRQAPQLPRETLVGPQATLASLLAGAHGKAAVVVFWASWCTPCEREAAALQRFASEAQGRGRIVGVDWNDALSGARAFVAHYRWTFPNVRDGDGTVGNAYRLTGLPTTFVIDSHGRIRSVLRGPQDGASLGRALAAVERA